MFLSNFGKNKNLQISAISFLLVRIESKTLRDVYRLRIAVLSPHHSFSPSPPPYAHFIALMESISAHKWGRFRILPKKLKNSDPEGGDTSPGKLLEKNVYLCTYVETIFYFDSGDVPCRDRSKQQVTHLGFFFLNSPPMSRILALSYQSLDK